MVGGHGNGGGGGWMVFATMGMGRFGAVRCAVLGGRLRRRARRLDLYRRCLVLLAAGCWGRAGERQTAEGSEKHNTRKSLTKNRQSIGGRDGQLPAGGRGN